MNHKHHFINGEWVASSGESFTSINPWDNTLLWQGKEGTNADVEKAFKAAHEAFALWSLLSFKERALHLENFREVILKNEEKMAYLISLETGKPLWESKTEVQSVLQKIHLSIQAYQERTPDTLIEQQGELASFVRYRPHGVIGILGAFNFPIHLANAQIIPALLAGNTIIYKPSELAPGVNQYFMECFEEAGFPKGVINCVQGGSKTGELLLQQPLQGVLFTGSYATGKKIHEMLSGRPEIILALEMGGNNPLIIDEPAYQKAAIYHTLLSAFLTAGQRCTSARRLLIKNNQNGTDFLKALIKATQTIKLGKFDETPAPFIGPLIRMNHAQHCLNAWEARIALGGKPLLALKNTLPNIPLLSPGLIDMTGVSNVPDEEVFGPLLQIYRYDDFEEALFLANNTSYGLVAGLIGDNASHFERFSQTMKTGLVNWNRPTTGASGRLPFGGIGRSGNHRPGGYFAADFCAYPVASLESPGLEMPENRLPGLLQWN